MKIRAGVFCVIAAGLLAVGCGSDDKAPAAAESTASASTAKAEVAEVRSGLEQAVATYASGDAKAADDQVATAYLEHFEHVEGPLEQVDPELKETLEDSIREELRAKIKAQAPEAEVEQLATAIKADLAKAEAALR